MSVRVNQYLVYGYMLDYKEVTAQLDKAFNCGGNDLELDDVLDPYRDSGYKKDIGSHDGISIIEDGMDGQYFFIGQIIEKAPIDVFLNTVSIPTSKPKKSKVVFDKIHALLQYTPTVNLGWHLLTHYH